MYSSTIGQWAHWLIALVAFLCIFGSALTVYDGYARVVAEAIALLFNKDKNARNTLVTPVLLFMAVASFIIVLFFKSALLAMLGFAMTLAFVTTPACTCYFSSTSLHYSFKTLPQKISQRQGALI